MAYGSEESTVDEEVSVDVEDEARPKLRSKMESWDLLPEGHRGIRLRELWDFYTPRQEWLEQLRWRCDVCHRSGAVCEGSPSSSRPPLVCQICEAAAGGRYEGRNLYEVCAEMIVPKCEALRVSYVELLRRGDDFKGVKANTFVSHWWGEEFPKFIRALSRFASMRCANLPWMLWAKQRDHEDWAFWICAFANNQFAIEHALGDLSSGSPRSAVMTSAFAAALDGVDDVVALLDDQAKIYTRIWCCFELFSVKRLLPARRGKTLEIFIVDESGVVSSGCGNVRMMTRLIQQVKTSEAQASNEADQVLIESAMLADGTTHEDLDATLRQLAKGGLAAFRTRRVVELVGMLTVLGVGCFALAMFATAFHDEHLDLSHMARGQQEKVKRRIAYVRDAWIFWIYILVAIMVGWFLLNAVYWKLLLGGGVHNNRPFRLNLRVSFLAFGIGLKVSLFCLLAKLIQHTVGSWAFIFVAIYCFGTIALILTGKHPVRRLLDPVFL